MHDERRTRWSQRQPEYFRNGQPGHDGDRNTIKVMTSTSQ